MSWPNRATFCSCVAMARVIQFLTSLHKHTHTRTHAAFVIFSETHCLSYSAFDSLSSQKLASMGSILLTRAVFPNWFGQLTTQKTFLLSSPFTIRVHTHYFGLVDGVCGEKNKKFWRKWYQWLVEMFQNYWQFLALSTILLNTTPDGKTDQQR